jgi:hypothetical protein
MIIYLTMAIELPPWALKAIDKIRRGFFGREEKMQKGGTAW